ncbi:Hypothetical protein DEACI_3929 [Acididesulfobacillus acetoxydans]|uniref:Uncharacterized protein n=1 Tax=Acididesulfobacillus acetoxydans TaxID=1561005 RepID=A0A8S0XD41_9FIRM|nr:Hypothetical protein DEACI_3929 [Acididesulfobacillus acetoxydans]CEJ05656.1 Hypothetical protein DEACI_0030 [Acididesulfobacillus acetoxydans]
MKGRGCRMSMSNEAGINYLSWRGVTIKHKGCGGGAACRTHMIEGRHAAGGRRTGGNHEWHEGPKFSRVTGRNIEENVEKLKSPVGESLVRRKNLFASLITRKKDVLDRLRQRR